MGMERLGTVRSCSELHWIDADAGEPPISVTLVLSDTGQAVGVGWNAFGQCDLADRGQPEGEGRLRSVDAGVLPDVTLRWAGS